jgi:hypothetical protein
MDFLTCLKRKNQQEVIARKKSRYLPKDDADARQMKTLSSSQMKNLQSTPQRMRRKDRSSPINILYQD